MGGLFLRKVEKIRTFFLFDFLRLSNHTMSLRGPVINLTKTRPTAEIDGAIMRDLLRDVRVDQKRDLKFFILCR